MQERQKPKRQTGKCATLPTRMKECKNPRCKNSRGEGRGVLLGIRGGGVPPGSPNPDPISDKKHAIFHTRFQTWLIKFIPVFRLDIYVYKGLNYATTALVRTPTTDLLKLSSNDLFWLFLFRSYSFEFEKTNMFIRSRGSLENHTRFQTIMVKIYTRFQTKTAQNPYPYPYPYLYPFVSRDTDNNGEMYESWWTNKRS